jgi:hypothetical protein
MEALVSTVPTLAVSALFCIWSAYRRHVFERRQRLRERVAHMLWVAAVEMD